jgi:succinyl-diaminopimelate desuccinylase
MRTHPALREDALVEVLSSLVETPSVNPGGSEGPVVERIAAWFEGTGAELTVVETLPGRPSLGAVLAGDPDGPRLVLNGHIDTVPVYDADQWRSDPFRAHVGNGHVYGRGACDMKGGLSVAIAVARALAEQRSSLRGTLILHFAAGEERAEPGTRSLLDAGLVGDFGIVLEPTELKVARASRGLVHASVRIRGRSAHASRPEHGENALAFLRPVLAALEEHAAKLALRSHPLLPPPTIVPTVVSAGSTPNTIPDVCELVVDRRLLPGETVAAALAELEACLAQLDGLQFEITPMPAMFEPSESTWGRFSERFSRIAGGEHPVGTPYASDMRVLVNEAAMEAVTYGPGKISECHCANERVATTQLVQAANTVYTFVVDCLTQRGDFAPAAILRSAQATS